MTKTDENTPIFLMKVKDLINGLWSELFFFNFFFFTDFISTYLLISKGSSIFYEANPLIIILFGPFQYNFIWFFVIVFVAINLIALNIVKVHKKWWFRGFLAYWAMCCLVNTVNNLNYYSEVFL